MVCCYYGFFDVNFNIWFYLGSLGFYLMISVHVEVAFPLFSVSREGEMKWLKYQLLEQKTKKRKEEVDHICCMEWGGY